MIFAHDWPNLSRNIALCLEVDDSLVMQHPWLTDRSGAIEALLGMTSTVNEAGSLLRYIITAGQLLVHRGGARGLVETNELAVLLSISFEAQRGVDVVARYGKFDELGPEFTHYGIAILGAFDQADVDLHWRDCLEARGLTVEHFWLEDASPLDYTLNLGSDFSRRAALAPPAPEPTTHPWTGVPSLPSMAPPAPAKVRATHTRGYAPMRPTTTLQAQ